MAERHLSYALLKCADEERDEALNVGIILFDDGNVICRVDDSLIRVERTLPNVPVTHLRALLEGAAEHLTRSIQTSGIEALFTAHEQWNNTLRVSRVRSILAEDAGYAASLLFERFVATPTLPTEKFAPAAAPDGESTPHRFSSKIVVRSLTSRLRKRRLQEGQHFRLNARFTGFTRGNVAVPVFFPIEAFSYIYLDGIEINEEEQDRTLDIARAMTQKTEETFRAQERSLVMIAVKDPEGSKLGDQVEKIIGGAESIRGQLPMVRRYSNVSELDSLLKVVLEDSPENQLDALDV